MNKKLFEDVKDAMLKISEDHPTDDALEVISAVVSLFRSFLNPDALADMLAILLLQTKDLETSTKLLSKTNERIKKLEEKILH